jgi:hypothetical protein
VDDARKPWEQLDDESELAFERFEIYLRLGPGRTVTLAYRAAKANEARAAALAAREAGVAGLLAGPEGGESRQTQAKYASGAFRDTARRHDWFARAIAWDREQFKLVVHEGIYQYAETFKEYVQAILSSLPSLRPASFKEATDGLALLSAIVPPEIFRAMLGADDGNALEAQAAGGSFRPAGPEEGPLGGKVSGSG